MCWVFTHGSVSQRKYSHCHFLYFRFEYDKDCNMNICLLANVCTCTSHSQYSFTETTYCHKQLVGFSDIDHLTFVVGYLWKPWKDMCMLEIISVGKKSYLQGRNSLCLKKSFLWGRNCHMQGRNYFCKKEILRQGKRFPTRKTVSIRKKYFTENGITSERHTCLCRKYMSPWGTKYDILWSLG